VWYKLKSCFLLATNEGSIGFVTGKMFFFIADFRVLGLFMARKSDAQARRVNTFHILQNIRKRPSTFRFCMEGPLRFLNF
jgi:hypothetical protein